MKIKPFLKWAGGKRWLVDSDQLPSIPKFNRYIEPFLGSGSLFFHLNPKSAILADANAELINCYVAIKNNPVLVRRYLADHQRHHSKKHYYVTRDQKAKSEAKRAANFLYLNRSCWNGLYRVNKQGIFNVPKGTKDSILFVDDDFQAVSKRLGAAEIMCSDFEKIVAQASAGDLVFADPPYTVLHNTNGFLKYNETIFSWEDQLRLKGSLVAAAKRGATVFLTNADHQSVRSIYANHGTMQILHRHSKLSGKANGRRPTTELLVQLAQ
jgi:DNA adenine methylase